MKRLFVILPIILAITFVLAGCNSSTSTTTKAAGTTAAQSQQPTSTSTAKPTTATTTTKPLPSIINLPTRPSATTGQILVGLAPAVSTKLGVKVANPTISDDTAQWTTMQLKQGDIACTGSTTLYDVVRGNGSAVNMGPQTLRALFRGPPNYILLVTSKKSGINTYADLKGKRVAYMPGSATNNETVGILMEAMGLTWDDVKKVNVDGTTVAVDALKSGVLDIPTLMLYPNTNLLDIDANVGLVILPFNPSPAAEKVLFEKRPMWPLQAVKKGQILGAMQDMRLPMSNNYLVAYDFLDENLAYQFTKAVYGVVEDVQITRDAGWTKAGGAQLPFFTPFHPGAVKFFKEAGIWTPEHEKMQQDLLKQEQDNIAAWKAKQTTK